MFREVTGLVGEKKQADNVHIISKWGSRVRHQKQPWTVWERRVDGNRLRARCKSRAGSDSIRTERVLTPDAQTLPHSVTSGAILAGKPLDHTIASET